VAVATQVSANLATLTLEDASGRLRAAQDAEAQDDALPPRSDGKLYLTREQWEVQAEKEKRCSSDAGGSGSKSGDCWGKARWGQGAGDERSGPVHENRPLGLGVSVKAQEGGSPRRLD
jgi:hypothetical protein